MCGPIYSGLTHFFGTYLGAYRGESVSVCTIVREGESVSVSGERESVSSSRVESNRAEQSRARSRADNIVEQHAVQQQSTTQQNSSNGIQEARAL